MAASSDWQVEVRRAFGGTVRQVRLVRQVSQEELAHISGLDRSYVGQVERGERNLSLENICRLAKGLSVPPSRLLDGINLIPAESPVNGDLLP